MRSGRGYWWLLWLTWMMLIVATARPQWIGEPIELPNTGRDLMLGLDLSGSMQIEDMQVGSRLVPASPRSRQSPPILPSGARVIASA